MPNKSVASQTLEDSACGLLVPSEEFVCPNCDTRFLHPKRPKKDLKTTKNCQSADTETHLEQ